MDASLMKRLKELEAVNSRLKKMYAEERLKADLRREALEGKLFWPSPRREMAKKGVEKHGISTRFACVAYGISESCYRYQPKLSG